MRRDFLGKMLGTGQDGGECCGKAIGEVNPSTQGKTTTTTIYFNEGLFFPVYWVNLTYGLPTTFSSTLTCPKHLPYKVPSFSYLLSTLLSNSSWAYLSFYHHLPAVSQFSLSNTTHLSSQHDQTTSTCFFT